MQFSIYAPIANGYNEYYNLQQVYVIDEFESFIWVDRYYKCGSFELYTTVNAELWSYCTPGNLIVNSESEHVMIIEDRGIESDSENGNHMKIIGRSFESVLDRRIIKKKLKYRETVSLDECIKDILDKNMLFIKEPCGGAINLARIVKCIEYLDQPNLKSALTGSKVLLEERCEFFKETILSAIESTCESKRVGFKMIPNFATFSSFEFNDKRFSFTLYTGVNRTYDYDSNGNIVPNGAKPVIFSDNYDNLISSNYTEQTSGYKNASYVYWGDADRRSHDMESGTLYLDARSRQVNEGKFVGLDRREAAIDCKGDSSSKLTSEIELAKLQIKKTFDAECDTGEGSLFKFGVDYFLGDIVQVRNEYGIEEKVMVTEFTWSYNSEGIKCYPTFVTLNEVTVDEFEDIDTDQQEEP